MFNFKKVAIMYKYYEEDKAMSEWMKKEYGEDCFNIPIRIMELEAPAAFPGDLVAFYNYRTPTEPTTTGKVVHLETHWESAEIYRHYYIVKPDGKSYTVKVRSVEKINQPVSI